MKKTFLLLAVLVLISSQANAQWSIGGKVGVNWSNIDYPGSTKNPSSLTGINIGAITSYQINEKFDIQGELLYSSRGYKEKNFVLDAEDASPKDLTSRYHYIDIPIVIKYSFLSDFNIYAGPQVGITLSNINKVDKERQKDFENKDLQTFDVGLVGGIGYEFTNGMFFDARYLLGLNSISKEVSGFKNRSIQLALGYKFRL